jgi:pyruvate ferredoxin oxidoreductase gamma subunit
MLEICIQGRGGQGAQVACQILAAAFFRAGAWVQAFAAYGGERRGAPVTASLRVDDTPIRMRCDVAEADHLLVLDSSLLVDVPPEILRTGGTVVVNSVQAPCGRMPGASRVVAVDASSIARHAGLGSIVSTAVLGAFAGATGLVTLDALLAAVEEWSPVKKQENVAACAQGYRQVTALAGATS